MKEFIERGERDSVKLDEEQYRTSENLLRLVLKGLIARDVFSDPGAYTYILRHRNNDLEAALSVINDERRYNDLLQRGNSEYERLAARNHEQAK